MKIIRLSNDTCEITEDPVIAEVPLTVFVNDYELVTLLCTPSNQRALVVGFLASEGLLQTIDDVLEMEFFYEDTVAKVSLNIPRSKLGLVGRRTLTSGCGGGITFYNSRDCSQAVEIESTLEVTSQHIFDLMRQIQGVSGLHSLTGGSHTVVLADREGLVLTSEDIGRHNAVDKVIGQAILDGLAFHDKILLASGRISSDMALKAVKRGIPIIGSRTAPTEMAVRLARQRGMTVLGFIRGNRMNIYSGEERIKHRKAR